jgi:hypothetical protein
MGEQSRSFCLTNNFSTIFSFLLQPLSTKLIHDSFGYQAAGDHSSGYSGAGMRAGSHEIQIFITRMPVGRPEVGQLSQRMSQSVS